MWEVMGLLMRLATSIFISNTSLWVFVGALSCNCVVLSCPLLFQPLIFVRHLLFLSFISFIKS